MTKAEQRAAIVEALEKLDYLTVSSSQPASITAGCAWPVWFKSGFLNACQELATWYVLVALPAGTEVTSVDAADEWGPDVATVLWPICKVVEYEGWRPAVEPGQQGVPCLRFTVEVS